MTMLAVKNFFLPERKAPDTPRFSRMPETFLRSIRRRSLRVKRTKSLVVPEKRKSGNRNSNFLPLNVCRNHINVSVHGVISNFMVIRLPLKTK